MLPQESASASAPARAQQEKKNRLRAENYLAIVLLVAAASFLFHMRFAGVFACPAPINDEYYLGYCNSSAYGDYDHGSFWLGLEPEATGDAQAADVLFLGNSRLQFGFSTSALARWFATRDARYYLLGFSHFENASFTGPLLERIGPRARAYVINLDDFFLADRTDIGDFVMRDRNARRRYENKRVWQLLQRRVCGVAPSFCGGEAFGYYRRRIGGDWRLGGSSAQLNPANVGPEQSLDRARAAAQAAAAEAFLSALKVSRDCIVFTYVPNAHNDRKTAEEIARALGFELVSPSMDGLATFDGSHLDPTSAERFSQAFLEAAGPQLQRCLSGGSL